MKWNPLIIAVVVLMVGGAIWDFYQGDPIKASIWLLYAGANILIMMS